MGRNTSNGTATKKTQSLSQIERHIASEKGRSMTLFYYSLSCYFRRICIVCGQLSLISTSVAYPKGRSRRKEFDRALNLPSHISRALPFGCYICGEHFRPSELDCSSGTGSLQISESVIPTLVCFYLIHILISLLEP